MTLQQMRDQRNKLVSDARALHERAVTEKRDMSAQERESFDKMMKDAGDIKADIVRVEQLEAEERDLATSNGRKTDPTNPDRKDDKRDDEPQVIEYRGKKIVLAKSIAHRASNKYANAFNRAIAQLSEARVAAFAANDVDADGGYLHAPLQFIAELLKTLDNKVFVRQYARVIPVTTGDSLGAPHMSVRPGDADWTSEVGNITPDVTAQLEMRELQPAQLTKEIDVSMKLLQTAAISPETIVRDELASLFARTEEKAYLTGDGTTGGQPLGVFTASASGISTGRDVSTSNTTTAITCDGLISAKYKLTAAYRGGARWLFHRDAIAAVAKLKDSDGQYLWQPSKQVDEPDVLLGHGVDESEYAPNTFTAGLYVGIFANWQYYWIADLMALTVQRLNELLARNSKIGFIGRKFTDGMPVKEEGFARVKLAAS